MSWLSCIVSNVLMASLLALAAWFVQRRLRLPALARVLWVLVLVKLVTPPLVGVPVGESPRSMTCALGLCGCDKHPPVISFVRDTLPWVLLTAWSLGAIVTGGMAWRRWARFQRLLAHAVPAPARWRAHAARLSAELGIRRPPLVLTVAGRLPPLVAPGWREPRLLLPRLLIDRLDRPQRTALLLHELVHIQRGDHWVRMLESMVSVAYWWLPIVRSIGRQMRTCEETCCDAAVVARLPQARRDYARLLLDVLDFTEPLSPQVTPQATAMSVADDLEQRLSGILDSRPDPRHTWLSGGLVLVAACVVLPCQLHFDSAKPPATGIPSFGCAAAVESCATGESLASVRLDTLCCPQ